MEGQVRVPSTVVRTTRPRTTGTTARSEHDLLRAEVAQDAIHLHQVHEGPEPKCEKLNTSGVGPEAVASAGMHSGWKLVTKRELPITAGADVPVPRCAFEQRRANLELGIVDIVPEALQRERKGNLGDNERRHRPGKGGPPEASEGGSGHRLPFAARGGRASGVYRKRLGALNASFFGGGLPGVRRLPRLPLPLTP